MKRTLAAIIERTQVDANGCWIWQGPLLNGYARPWFDRHGNEYAHRVSYELATGHVPGDLTVDHLCFTPACMNPDHLRAVTNLENAKRQRSASKTHCVNGHEFTAENTRIRSNDGRRFCRACNRETQRRIRAQKVAV